MAFISRMDLSELQIAWDFNSTIFIFAYAPLCILLGLIGTLNISTVKPSIAFHDNENKSWNVVFYLFVFLFFAQFAQGLPPALSSDPMNNRLTWGVKYLHVLTEIVFRTSILLCLGTVVNRGKFLKKDFKIILPILAYSFLVVSRGMIIEIIFYIVIASIFLHSKKYKVKLRLSFKHYAAFAGIWIFFIAYGQWRQGSEFSISDYGKMHNDNPAMSWIFGYFLVNFDNLALIIGQKYQNFSISNVFGPLLQTFQIAPYMEIDDYLYVGRFNLGTALRPFVLDYGPWVGGLVFSFLWAAWIKILDFCTFEKSRFTILLLLAYAGFCFPLTGRIEQPPYLIPLSIIILLDWGGNYKLHRKMSLQTNKIIK